MADRYKAWVQQAVSTGEKPSPLTGRARLENWWYYNKWFLLGGILLGAIVLRLILGALGVGRVRPDYQIAYLGAYRLPEQTAGALTEALEALGQDLNGDGQVVVQLNQYAGGAPEGEAGLEQAAAETALMADLTEGESYFFLLEDPGTFQKEYQLLARRDGSCPEEGDRSAEDKVFRWGDCPVLAGLALGEYQEELLGQTISGDSQHLLENLYLGRRCFYPENPKQAEFPEGCAALWEELTKGAHQ